MPKFTVTLCRNVVQNVYKAAEVTVEAQDEEQACKRAQELADLEPSPVEWWNFDSEEEVEPVEVEDVRAADEGEELTGAEDVDDDEASSTGVSDLFEIL